MFLMPGGMEALEHAVDGQGGGTLTEMDAAQQGSRWGCRCEGAWVVWRGKITKGFSLEN